MGICYPQYWLQANAEDNFNRHLELIKSHYYIERHLEPIKLSNSNTSLEMARIFPSILFANGLEIQASIFKITMKFNDVATMEAPFHINPLTWLWRTLEASRILRHSFLKKFKLAKLVIVQVLGSVEDEHAFSTLFFMKSKLKNRFKEHLHTIVRMYSQTFFTLNTFPYDTCFDDRKEQKPRWSLN
jgi:hypothetical protein